MGTKRKKPDAPQPPAQPAKSQKPVRGTSVVEPRDPEGAEVATGRSVVPPPDRTAES